MTDGPAGPSADNAPAGWTRSGSAADHSPTVPGSVAEWEEHYSGAEAVWSGNPNAALVAVVTEFDLTPGRSLDVGCGEGADVLWLAGRGWQATGIDLSETAIARARTAAERTGIRADFAVANLADWADDADEDSRPRRGGFDLVTGCFLHTRLPETRDELLTRLGELVAPGGRLVLISHAGVPPWAAGHGHAGTDAHEHEADDCSHDGGHSHDGFDFSTPEADFALLEAGGTGVWELNLGETRTRSVTGPDGTPVDLEDGLLVARKV